jgi:hypothetical protein
VAGRRCLTGLGFRECCEKGRVRGSVNAPQTALNSKPLGGSGFGFGGLFFAILWRRFGFQRTEKASGDAGYFIDGGEERGFVGLRRLGEATDLSNELDRSGADFVFGDGRIEVEKYFDVAAHLTTASGYQKTPAWRFALASRQNVV